MKKRFFFILFLFYSFVIAYAQHTVMDSFTNEKISFVEVYSDKGNFIGSTDIDGSVSKELENKMQSSNAKSLTFVNSFYENRVVAFADFDNNKVIKMTPIVHQLREVKISNKKDKNKFLILSAYVRSLQINDDRVQYFMDGIVEYYISLKTKKIKLKFISNRSFANKSIPQLKETGFKVYFQIVGAPMLSEFLNYSSLNEKYNLQKSLVDVTIKSKEDNSLHGGLYLSNSGISMTLGIIMQNKPKVMIGLGVENKLNNYTINSFFGDKDFENIGFNSLLYFKETRNYDIKAKKDKKAQKIDATHEVFVLDYRFTEKIDTGKLNDNYSFVNSSNYQDKYWHYVKNVLYQPLPNSINKYIDENLTEIKK